jgi:hypothetical protein
MEEFNILKMEYAFMKVNLLIYQKKSKRTQAKQWELYKGQIGENSKRHLNLTRKTRGCIN